MATGTLALNFSTVIPKPFRPPKPRGAFTTVARSSLSDISLLFQAAKHTVDSYVKSGMVVGLGSGDASTMAIQYLGLQLRSGSLKDIVAISTSVDSATEAAKAGIPLGHYEEGSQVDITFDDADVIEKETLFAVIGRRKLGEESLIQEKSVLRASSKVVLIVTEKQCKDTFEGSIPVLILPVSWLDTAEEIDDLFLGDAEVWRRSSIGHSDPLGGDFPLVTKDGYNVLDVIFTSPVTSLADIAETLDQVKGVVAHGVICNVQCRAVVATAEGIQVLENAQNKKYTQWRSQKTALTPLEGSNLHQLGSCPLYFTLYQFILLSNISTNIYIY